MKNSEHWLVCVDFTNMDEILTGYTSFLKNLLKPKTVSFLHIIETGPTARSLIDQFPEIETEEQFVNLLRNELNETLDEHFDRSDVEVRIFLNKGRPTNKIIEMVNSLEPDLLIMGKKVGFAGEGVTPKRILKYVPASILFVPENSRFSLQNILVPVDFSELSAKGLRTALELVKNVNGTVIAQHIYEYRAQFFPYVLTDEEKRKIDAEMGKKRDKFLEEFEMTSDINFILTRHQKGKLAESVYHEMIRNQADLIVVGSKAKKLPSLISNDFTEKMVDYSFGVPLLILKNRERYAKFLDTLFRD